MWGWKRDAERKRERKKKIERARKINKGDRVCVKIRLWVKGLWQTETEKGNRVWKLDRDWSYKDFSEILCYAIFQAFWLVGKCE